MSVMCRRSSLRRWRSLTFTLGVIFSSSAEAATISVSTTVDDVTVNGNCTLREAVIAANTNAAVDACSPGSGPDVIVLPAGTYVLTVVGFGEDAALTGDLDVTEDLEIDGSGQAVTVIDGNAADRVIDVDPGITGISAILRDVSIANGAGGFGGGVRNQGNLSIFDSTVRNNAAAGSPPRGGGIGSAGALMISASTVRNNTAGSGLFSSGEGGGVYADNLVLIDSTISGNNAGGMTQFFAFGFGGGIYLANGTITNSTVSGNTSISSSGIAVVGGSVTISNTTIFNVLNLSAPTDTVIVRNTIIYSCGPIAGTYPLVANAYNIDSDNSCGLSGTDLPGVDPLLGFLLDNGGPTFTHALLPGSPARNAGSPAIPGSGGDACESNDQRGVVRPQESQCDIGAFEGPCGDGALDPGEQCDINAPLGPHCCVFPCTFTPPGTLCRPAADDCGIDEFCDGMSAACPPDLHLPFGTPCGSNVDDQCTNPDTCQSGGLCSDRNEPDGTPCDDGFTCTLDDSCSDGVCTAAVDLCFPLNHYQCYQGRHLRDPKFAKSEASITDQISSGSVTLLKLKYVCNPVAKTGEPILDPNAHLSCYQIKAPNLTVRPRFLVSTQFQESRFEAKKAKLLCMPSTKTVVP